MQAGDHVAILTAVVRVVATRENGRRVTLRWRGVPSASVIRAARDVQGGQEIFMELDPHDVTGVAVGGVDPGILSSSCLDKRSRVQRGVAVKAGQAIGELTAQAPEGTLDGHQRLQYSLVPAPVGVIVERHGLAPGWANLPVSASRAESPVERQELLVSIGDDVPDAGQVELGGKAPLVLLAPGVSQRPARRSAETQMTYPSPRLVVQQHLLNGAGIEVITA